MDGTIANVAFPTIARDLDVSAAASNAYHLAVIIALLPLASLGDIIGYRRIYLGGIVVFSLISLVCALSDSLWTRALARVLSVATWPWLFAINVPVGVVVLVLGGLFCQPVRSENVFSTLML